MKKLFFAVMIFACAGLLASCSLNETETNGVLGKQISFPSPGGDVGITAETKIEYDLPELEKQVAKQVGRKGLFLYSDPLETDYSAAEKLGFDRNVFEEKGGKRYYKNGKESMEIDRFGSFSYSCESLGAAYSYSDKESAEIARTFLKKHDLFPDGVSKCFITGHESSYSPGTSTETLLAVTVTFYFPEMDGCRISGEGIDVCINGKGEVTYVYYTRKGYQKKEKAILIPLREAVLKWPYAGISMIEDDITADRIVIETAEVMYHADSDPESTIMQPVYCFTGTAYSKNGTSSVFSAAVQANRY